MAFNKKNEKRSPLKRQPLRNPGESLERELDRLYEEEILPYPAMALMAVILTIYEWLFWFFKMPPQPLIFTAIALMIIGISLYKFFNLRRQIQSLKLGLAGEKAVGQYLEQLRTEGCHILHDIPGEGFNVDHIVVSPRGIFIVETKTISKPYRGKPIVFYDGERVLVNGTELDRDVIAQANAARKWVQHLLFGTTDRNFPVKAIIVFPGWYTQVPQDKKKGDIWVLNDELLPGFIKKEAISLKSEDVALVASRISDHVRSHLNDS